MRIRDPIHGAIALTDDEVPVLDSGFFQRLRHIKQLGFGELAFPGATHTRHAHSLGAMHVATRLFDAVFATVELPGAEKDRLRKAVRLSVLCHDLGHLPLSHASECIAPKVSSLGLPAWVSGRSDRQASHEDFTAKLLLDSSLTEVLRVALVGHGLSPPALAALVLGVDPPGGPPFVLGGRDFGPVLRQLVSGELDADRMDYLLRDSFYTGVNYGRYDLDWIVQNLLTVEREGRVFLALSKSAIFAFEDFLLSRFHMFVSVYLHHTSVNFDEMLRRFYEEAPGELEIPGDPERFLTCDDVALYVALRASKNRWAKRIASRKGYKLVAQVTDLDRDFDIDALTRRLAEESVDHFTCESRGILSKYFATDGGPPVYVVDAQSGRVTPVGSYTPLYQRYSAALRFSRVYCRPEDAGRARALLGEAVRSGA